MTKKFFFKDLQRVELEYVSAAGCCVCLSCWHPVNVFDKTPYPSLWINYETEKECIARCSVLEHVCGHEWHPDKKCNQAMGRVEDL